MTRKVYQGKYLYAIPRNVPILTAMNPYTAKEHLAALRLQEMAAHLVCTYAEPEDAPAARLAALMQAAENEARAQGITAPLVFQHGERE